MPPMTLITEEYAVFSVPDTRVAFSVSVGVAAFATTMERATDLVCAGLPASVTVAVKLKVPVAVGVPEMTPVAGARLSPAGRLPVRDHVYGVVPPLACRVAV